METTLVSSEVKQTAARKAKPKPKAKRDGRGSLYLRNGTYYGSLQINGKQVQFSTGRKIEREAWKILDQRREQETLKEKNRTADAGVTVNRLLDLVEQEIRTKNYQADTSGNIRNLREWFGKVVAVNFGNAQWHELHDKLMLPPKPGEPVPHHYFNGKQPPFANATFNRYISVLRRGYTLAWKHNPQLLKRDEIPPNVGERLSETGNARDGQFTPEQFEAVLAELPEYLRGVAIFGEGTGLRKHAILRATRKDVDFDTWTIRPVPPARGKSVPKIVPVSGRLREWLAALKPSWDAEKKPDALIFTDPQGGQIVRLNHEWERATKRAGCPERLFHDLRRTRTRWLMQRYPINEVAQMTGHSDLKTLMRNYANTRLMTDVVKKNERDHEEYVAEQEQRAAKRLPADSEKTEESNMTNNMTAA